MAKDTVPIGVLFSASGPYAAIGAEGLAGARLAIAEINATDRFDFSFSAQIRDPQGSTESYAPLAADIVTRSGARHIVGCTTSWSRKEVIPLLEKSGTKLWYPCPYEGFEAHEQVIYLGACPNQHILPLLDYIMPRFGSTGYLVGSNYIWGWETNRIARDAIETAGGIIAGERYVPLGDEDVARLIDEIRSKQPAFILNTLIGPSSYAFLAAYHALGQDDPRFLPSNIPVLSCNLAEMELAMIGPGAVGHYAVSPYFQSLASKENVAFLGNVERFAPQNQSVSAFFAQSYAAIHLLAASIAAASSDSMAAIDATLPLQSIPAPFGPLRIDPRNNHAVLTPRIARASMTGFDIVSNIGPAIQPDPFLAHQSLQTAPRASHLRVVK